MKTSITKIEKVYETSGSYPFLVMCDDLEYYVVKYKNHNSAFNLLNEYLAASFLKIWKLHVPDFSFVEIKEEHWISDSNLNPFDYNHICFGSKFSRNFSEITLFIQSNPKYRREHFFYNEEILEIALFDIWLSNEDRSANNPNLMFDMSKRNRIVPIDHQYIFNSSSLHNGISTISFSESILYSPIIKSFLKKSDLKDKKLLDRIEKKYFNCIKMCQNQFDVIIKNVPENWNIQDQKTKILIESQIFDDDWINNTWKTFINFVQTLVNNS